MTGAGSTSYDLADTTVELGISDGPRKGQTVTLRQVTRRVPAKAGATRQIHALTSRTDLAAGEVCWRLTSRWREENYFRYARTHFALDALDSYAATPDDPARLVPNPAKKAAAAQVRHAEVLAAAAQAQRDASLAALRNPAPGQPVTITNQMINALDAPVEAAWAGLQAAQDAAAAVPARIRLDQIAPDMVRLDAEIKQITHAIRMAAYNAETALARALDGHYARAGDEAYALIREALTSSGDIIPGHGELLIRLDPLTAPRRTQALAALCDQLTQAHARYPGTLSLWAVNSDSRRCWRVSKIEYRYRTLSPRALNRRAAPLSAARLEQGEVMLTGFGQPAFNNEQARRCRAGDRGRRCALIWLAHPGLGSALKLPVARQHARQR